MAYWQMTTTLSEDIWSRPEVSIIIHQGSTCGWYAEIILLHATTDVGAKAQ